MKLLIALEYAVIIWDHIPEYLKNRRYTTRSCKDRDGGNKLASKKLLYIETGWITLYKRIDHRLI